MAIEHLLAQLTEGTNWRCERLDRGVLECPIEKVAGTLGALQHHIALRRSKRSAAMATQFGLDLLITRCTGNSASRIRDLAVQQCATLGWHLFWEAPANEAAKVTKATFKRIGEVALNDHCDPGHYRGISPNAMARELRVDRKTFIDRLQPVYGVLKAEISRIEYPAVLEFWRVHHGVVSQFEI